MLSKQCARPQPESIDDYVPSIEARALSMTGQAPQASALRQNQIGRGSHNTAFYTTEAEYQASISNAKPALALLDLAEQRGCATAYTSSIRTRIERGSQQI